MRVLAFLLIAAILLSGCAQKIAEKETIQITDLSGRSVEVPEKVERIIAIGPGALRLVVYLNATDKVVGVEDSETLWDPMGRPYRMAHPELAEKPVIGKGGPSPTPDAEKIAELKPDVIFISANPQIADALQRQTGIPTVVISYGTLGKFDDEVLFKSIRLMGKILGKEERAEEIIKFIEDTTKDLENRTTSSDLKVYVGALSYKGGHGIESTQCDFPPLVVLKANNVACEGNVSGAIFIDKEKLAVWDPDIIFIDESNLALVKTDYDKNPKFYESLSAFRNCQVYGILPFNYYWTNIEIALADAYYMGKVIYPDNFKDIDPEKKADEIIEFFVGKPLYDDLKEYYGGFKNICSEFQ